MSEKIPQSHTEAKEGLENTIDSKVDLLADFNAFIADPDKVKNVSSQELNTTLEEKLKKYCGSDSSSNEKLDQVQKVYELRKEILDAKKLVKDPDQKHAPGDIAKIREARKEKEVQLKTILENDDVKFLYQAKEYIKYITTIKEDHDQFRELQQRDEEEFKNSVNNFLGIRFRHIYGDKKTPEDFFPFIKEINCNGLDVCITLKKIARKRRIFDHYDGRHFSRSPVIIIFENSEQDVHTHERNHIVYERLDMHKNVYADVLIEYVSKRLKSDPVTTRLINAALDQDYSPTEDILKKIDDYHNSLNGEILADLDGIFNNRIIYGFWGHFIHTMASLKKLLNDPSIDPEVSGKINQSIEDLEMNTSLKVRSIERIAYLAKHFNLTEEVKSAFILFEGDVRKVMRYIEHKVGSDKLNEMPKYTPRDQMLYKSKADRKFLDMIEGMTKKEN